MFSLAVALCLSSPPKQSLYATSLRYSYSYSYIMLRVHQAGEQKKPLNSQYELYC